MEEQHAVLGLHRVIDAAAQRSDEAAGAAATVFPAYAEGAAGWSDAFERLITLQDQSGEAADMVEQFVGSVYPDPDDALEQLAEVPPRTAWQGVRRLQALTALVRVSEEFAPNGAAADLVQRALLPLLREGFRPDEFHELLMDHATLTHEGWNEQVDHLVQEAGLRSTYAAVRSGPTCSADIIGVVIEGDTEPVTALSTVFSHPTLTIADLDNLFDPGAWPDCPGFWCEMIEEGGPAPEVRRFLEVVASDCTGSWKISTRLDFRRRDYADGSSSLDYWLSDDQSLNADGMVVVDEGSILVTPQPSGGIVVESTKRIRFIEPMDGAQLAATSCALGWADAGQQFVFGCVEGSPDPNDPDLI